MKNALYCGFLALAMGCASSQLAGPAEKVIDLPGMTKRQIFEKARQWLTYRFVSGRAVLDYQDFNTGRLIAKGTLTIQQPMGSRVEVHVISTIDSVAGKTRITVDSTDCASVAPNGARYPCEGMFISPGAREEVLNLPEKFAGDYESYMKGGAAPAWDGK